MKKCILPSNWIEIMSVVNMLAEHFSLNVKSIKVFENGNCSLDCYKRNKSSIDTINVSIVFIDGVVIADIYSGFNHQTLEFKKIDINKDDMYVLTVKNCGIYYQGQYFYKKQNDNSYIKINEINAEIKYKDEESINKNIKKGYKK